MEKMMNKTEQLISVYQKQVDEIPKERPLVTLACESMLAILKSLEENHKPDESQEVLLRAAMKASKGSASPTLAETAIMLWKNSKN